MPFFLPTCYNILPHYSECGGETISSLVPVSLLETQNLRSHSGSTESESAF